MKAQRAAILVGAMAVGLGGVPAAAQVDDGIVLNIMRECAKISDPTARLACYDNNIRSAGANPRSVPGAMPAPQGGVAPVAPVATEGFGSDNIRTPERFTTAPGSVDEVSVRISGVTEREPGVYLVQLSDGAQWQFAESVGRDYRPPRSGEVVEIRRGALGSYLMQVGNQQVVQVRRVR